MYKYLKLFRFKYRVRLLEALINKHLWLVCPNSVYPVENGSWIIHNSMKLSYIQNIAGYIAVVRHCTQVTGCNIPAKIKLQVMFVKININNLFPLQVGEGHGCFVWFLIFLCGHSLWDFCVAIFMWFSCPTSNITMLDTVVTLG